MLTFNNLKEMESYYIAETNTYFFKDDIIIKFHLNVDADIDARNIDAGNINAGNINSWILLLKILMLLISLLGILILKILMLGIFLLGILMLEILNIGVSVLLIVRSSANQLMEKDQIVFTNV